MFRLPLFFVFPVLIQMSSLRHSNRSKRPSSRAAVQAPPPQRRRLTVQQDKLAVAVPPPPEPAAAIIPSSSAVSQLPLQQANMAVAAPAPSFPSTPGPAVVPFNTPASALQILPSVISQTVASVTSEVNKNLQHLLPSAPGPSSTRTVHQAQMSSLLLPLLQLLLLLTQSQTLMSRLLLLPPIHYKVFRKPTLNGNLRGNLYTPADLSFDAQSGSMQLESRHRSGPTSILI